MTATHEIDAAVAAFLARGGKITAVPEGRHSGRPDQKLFKTNPLNRSGRVRARLS
jgi:hypothetical protein